MRPKEEPYAYVKRTYGVNPVIGARVSMGTRSGVIVAKRSYDHYVHVRFDGSKFDVPVHPEELNYDDAARGPQSKAIATKEQA